MVFAHTGNNRDILACIGSVRSKNKGRTIKVSTYTEKEETCDYMMKRKGTRAAKGKNTREVHKEIKEETTV